MKGAMGQPPAVVVQGDDRGGEVILGLAISKREPEGRLGRSFNASLSSSASATPTFTDYLVSGADPTFAVSGNEELLYYDEELESEPEELDASRIPAAALRSGSRAWKNMRKMLSKLLFRKRATRPSEAEATDSATESGFSSLDESMDVIMVLDKLSEDEHNVEVQREVAMSLWNLTFTSDENKRTIAHSFRGMQYLIGLLSARHPETQFFAAYTLQNLAEVRGNIGCFLLFEEAVTALVRLLSSSAPGLARKGAVGALASLSFWRDGAKLILDSPNAIEGLVAMSLPLQSGDFEPYRGHDHARRALLNLSRWWEDDSVRVLDVPNVLAVLAGLLDLDEIDDLIFGCRSMREKATRAFASLSSTITSAHMIAHSPEFPLVLTVLVRLLVRKIPKNKGPIQTSWLSARKMATLALANLCVTEEIQVTIANHPEALTGLFKSLQAVRGWRNLVGANNTDTFSQVQEWAAMALGNLSLAPVNRRKIAAFGMLCHGLGDLGNILYQDTNPAAQEHAAWALANISEDVPGAPNGAAGEIAACMKIMGGLAHLLELPKGSVDGHVRNNQEPVIRIRAREEAARAIMNLSYATQNCTRIMSIPSVVKPLLRLMSHHGHPSSSPVTENYASRAISHLSATEAFWGSSEIFAKSLPGLMQLLSSDAANMCDQTKVSAAIIAGNLAQLQANQWKIISSKLVMEGIVKLLHGLEKPRGSEEAARVIFILANGHTYFTKIALALFPGLVPGLQKLLGIRGDVNRTAREHAEQALEGLSDFVFIDA